MSKPEQFEVWDWVVTTWGVIRQITNDDMMDLPYEKIERLATEEEKEHHFLTGFEIVAEMPCNQ